MTLLNFEKPKKVEKDVSFDGGPPGGYVAQMSNEDAARWKAKRFNKGKEDDRIELRKCFGDVYVTIFVALDGWNFGKKHEHRKANSDGNWYHNDTRGLNVRMSMNGSLLLTFEQFAEIDQIVNEARAELEKDFRYEN